VAPAKGPKKSAAPADVSVRLPITLGQFLKAADLVSSGGEGKMLIVEGLVTVNGQLEQRRGHKLAPGDVVQARGKAARVAAVPAAPRAAPPHSAT
jgi:ribosome-associated protein